jgi:hypothetical protein
MGVDQTHLQLSPGRPAVRGFCLCAAACTKGQLVPGSQNASTDQALRHRGSRPDVPTPPPGNRDMIPAPAAQRFGAFVCISPGTLIFVTTSLRRRAGVMRNSIAALISADLSSGAATVPRVEGVSSIRSTRQRNMFAPRTRDRRRVTSAGDDAPPPVTRSALWEECVLARLVAKQKACQSPTNGSAGAAARRPIIADVVRLPWAGHPRIVPHAARHSAFGATTLVPGKVMHCFRIAGLK